MAGDPRSTNQWTQLARRYKAAAAARNQPCAAPACTLGPIRYDLGNNHPYSANIDHIIEVDRGGNPFDPNNMRVTHCRCNAAAGARYRNQKHKPPPNSRRW